MGKEWAKEKREIQKPKKRLRKTQGKKNKWGSEKKGKDVCRKGCPWGKKRRSKPGLKTGRTK